VVLACHPDQARRLLEPSFGARTWLGRFSYTANRAFVHQDSTFMPVTRSLWSSWNFHQESDSPKANPVSVTYWMNRLQRLSTREPYFVTLNAQAEPRRGLACLDFEHPCYNLDTLRAQEEASHWQGIDGLYFAGAWLGQGFHEDGLASAVALARHFGLPLPWLNPQPDQGARLDPVRSPTVASDLDSTL
ncbi:amine oxidase, partial [mine drainage metagenome]